MYTRIAAADYIVLCPAGDREDYPKKEEIILFFHEFAPCHWFGGGQNYFFFSAAPLPFQYLR
jgi:hypothetical protein